ncbi:MAG TPA: aminotransferase [Desulfovibrio sp.]|nr:aminotransferase [Desulfovibrio sp.]
MDMKNSISDFALYGGKKVFSTFRTTTDTVPPDREVFFKYAKRAFEHRQFTNNGENVKELERKLAVFHEMKHCIAVSSGFSALMLAVRTLALPHKTEVIIPSLAYRSSGDILEWAGFIPHFCDVEAQTRAVSVQTVEKCINKKTAALVIPHPMVTLCDIDGIVALAKKDGLPLIFDSVEAVGASYKGRMIGGFGDAETFSMHGSKLINSAEGGYITTNNDELADLLRKMRAFGFVAKDMVDCLGFNAKLNELHSAMGLAGLSWIERQISENKAIHLAYQEHFKDIAGLEIVPYEEKEKQNWKTCLVKINSEWPFTRDFTLKILNTENINAREYYNPPLHLKYAKDRCVYADLPNTEKVCQEYFLLPFGCFMSVDDTKMIAEVLKAMLRFKNELLAKG